MTSKIAWRNETSTRSGNTDYMCSKLLHELRFFNELFRDCR